MDLANTTLRTLEDGESTFGVFVTSMSPRAAEVVGTTGVDWICVDMEHSPVTAAGVEGVIRGIERHGVTPLVRLPSIDDALAGATKRALDAGAQGLIVPRVESAAQAEAVVEAARFPLDGDRGVAGGVRANEYGRAFETYVRGANDEILVIAQVETAAGAANAEEILAVEGLDGAFVGENDLSATHGHPGEHDREAVQADLDGVLAAAEDHGKYTGVAARTPERIEKRLDDGVDMLLIGSDLALIRDGVEGLLE